MSALTDLARDKPCMIRLPGICSGIDAETVPCHLPLMDFHGVALKASDIFVAWGCRACHDFVDARVRNKSFRVPETMRRETVREVARLAHYDGMYRTLAYIIERHPDVLIEFIKRAK